MPKGYWIAHVDVVDLDEYRKYVEAGAAAFAKYGGVVLARGGKHEIVEGNGRSRNVIWEFPTYQAALDCYNSPEYQHAKSFRTGFSTGDFTLVEGV